MTNAKQKIFRSVHVSNQIVCSVTSVVSDYLGLSGLQPVRLLCPWDSPGKITGVACHAFLQGIFPDPGIKPSSPEFLALQADSFTTEPPGKP